jgi:hypothetical protein
MHSVFANGAKIPAITGLARVDMRCAVREPSFGTSTLRCNLAFGFAVLLRQALLSFGNMLAHQPFRPIAVSFFDGVDSIALS